MAILQVNAISMMGLLCSWVLELHYVLVTLVVAFFSAANHFREIVAIAKLLEFVLIPILQESKL